MDFLFEQWIFYEPYGFIYLNNGMHRSALLILPMEKFFIILTWNFEVNSNKMKRMKRKPCPARINRVFRKLIPGKKNFVFDDAIYNKIAKETKIPCITVRKCVQDYQPFVRLTQIAETDLNGNY